MTPGDWAPLVHPLAEATTIQEIEEFRWPDMSDPSRVAHVGDQANRLAEQNEFAIMATPWLLFPLERAFAMQGMDTFLMNLAVHPEFSEALLWKIEEVCKTLMGHFLDALGSNVDIIKIGDDLGVNVPASELVDAIKRHRPDAVGMSAFLTTTMGEVARNIRLIEGEGLRDNVKILVGGAP